MRRGEVWRYQPVAEPPGQSHLRLIISANAVNDVAELPVVLAVHVVDTDPGNLLAVQVGVHGWARVLSIEPVLRRRLIERVGVADTETMEAVGAALRAVQDL